MEVPYLPSLMPIPMPMLQFPPPLVPVPLLSDSIIVVDVWDGGEKVAVDEILSLLTLYPIVSVDVEFVECGTHGSPCPFDVKSAYDQMRLKVNSGDVVQLGFAICDDEGQTPGKAWQFNLWVDTKARKYDAASLEFITNQSRINLSAHRDYGIQPWRAATHFARLLTVADGHVTWICFHGGADVGFLLKLAGGGYCKLPSDRPNFINLFNKRFPCFCDLKLAAKGLRLYGSLSSVAVALGATRLGCAHQAGSDAILTLRCYMILRGKHGMDSISPHFGKLTGIQETVAFPSCVQPLTLTCSIGDAILVQVTNKDMEAHISDIKSIAKNTNSIISLEIQMDNYDPALPTPDPQKCYHSIINDVKTMNGVKLMVAVSDNRGELALGRVWQFHFAKLDAGAGTHDSTLDDDGFVPMARFATFMHVSGLLMNQKVTWVVCRGAHTAIFLLMTILPFNTVPSSSENYIRLRQIYLPKLFDTSVLSCCYSDSPSAIALKLGVVSPLMRPQGDAEVTEGSRNSAVLDSLSCFIKLSNHEKFPMQMIQHQGVVLSECCAGSVPHGSNTINSCWRR